MDKIKKAKNVMNQKYIDILSELVNMIQIESDFSSDQKVITVNEFRLRAIKYIIKLIEQHNDEITSGDDLMNYPRVGKKSVAKINEIHSTGKLKELDEMKKKYSKYLKITSIIDELTQVVGIGRKMASDLVENYHVTSIEDLKMRYGKGEIPLNEKVVIGLKYAGKFEGKIPRKEMLSIQKLISKQVTKVDNLSMTMCGSFRRGLPYSNDIDILLYDDNLQTMDDVKQSTLLKSFVKQLKNSGFIIDDIAGDDITTKYMGFCKYKSNPPRRIDIRLVPYQSYFTALLYFTGSYELNKIMRSKAKKMGYKLSEYGLYKEDKIVSINSEEDVFEKLDMEYLPPEERNIV